MTLTHRALAINSERRTITMADESGLGQLGQNPESRSLTIADLARSLASEPTVQATLQRIVDMAVEEIDGCEGAGILLIDKGTIAVGAWSNDLVRRIEHLEFEVGEGPCIDAIWQRPVFESADLHDQILEWPKFVPGAIESGIESMLAFRLFAVEETLGALDLYSGQRGGFDESARAFGAVFAAHAALALVGAQIHERDLATAANLREALATRDLIGQAKGVLMANQHIDADTAFALLRTTSQLRNEKLRLVAEYVVETGTLPDH